MACIFLISLKSESLADWPSGVRIDYNQISAKTVEPHSLQFGVGKFHLLTIWSHKIKYAFIVFQNKSSRMSWRSSGGVNNEPRLPEKVNAFERLNSIAMLEAYPYKVSVGCDSYEVRLRIVSA